MTPRPADAATKTRRALLFDGVLVGGIAAAARGGAVAIEARPGALLP